MLRASSRFELTLQSKYNAPVTIAPSKTALVIIDMQNFFLSAALGRSKGEGHAAEDNLLKHGIPAARKAGIQVIYVTWGILEKDLQMLPPSVWWIFGWNICDDGMHDVKDDGEDDQGTLQRKEKKGNQGIGTDIGNVTLEDGTSQAAGKMLLKDQWNTELHDRLLKSFEEGQKAKLADVRFHKTRLSGFWDVSSDLHGFLRKEGIMTLLFTGVNTDQRVLASIQDACNQGFDTIMLKDGCGTTSPQFATDTCVHNCQKSWGFLSSCKELEQGVEKIQGIEH
ncbi:Isochorismatase-like protein [Phaeosphaeriaceae sp. PMI808]|nr:Isochorismatase-like protein [Phaeosphaeriaceae sp. PMI808]